MADSVPVKAYLETVDLPGGESGQARLTFEFNPSELAFSRSIAYKRSPTERQDTSDTAFQGGGFGSVTLNLLFDSFGRSSTGQDENVRNRYESTLHKMMAIQSNVQNPPGPRPALVRFVWGEILTFKAVVTQVAETLILFNASGTPLRAKVAITLQQVADIEPKKAQNPTSRGARSMTLHRVQDGDSLPALAQHYYGDCNRWREIADANRLVRLRQLTPGTLLRLPDV